MNSQPSTSSRTIAQRIARIVSPAVLVTVVVLLAVWYLQSDGLEQIPASRLWGASGNVIVALLSVVTPGKTQLAAFTKIGISLTTLFATIFLTLQW